jgi:hypothetical protein
MKSAFLLYRDLRGFSTTLEMKRATRVLQKKRGSELPL